MTDREREARIRERKVLDREEVKHALGWIESHDRDDGGVADCGICRGHLHDLRATDAAQRAEIERLEKLLKDEREDRQDYEDLAELNGEVADDLKARVERYREALEWYGEKAEALSRYLKVDMDAGAAVVTELELDAGDRAHRALNEGEDDGS